MHHLFIGMALTALLSACQTVTIPNAQFIGSLGPSGAVTFDLLDGATSDLTLAQFAAEWNDLSNADGPLVCTRTQTLANLKMDLESLCSWMPGACNAQAQATVNTFMSKVQSISGVTPDGSNSNP